MKKFIKIVFFLFFISIQLAIELYPSGKLLVKKYVSEIDYENVLNTKPIAKYMSHLSTNEKDEIASILRTLSQTKN